MTRADGFTLVELLAALVAGSLLLIVLGSNVASLGLELRVATDDKRLYQPSPVARTLTNLIEQAIPASDDTITNAADEFVFLSSPPEALGSHGPLKVSLFVRRKNGQETLFVSFAPTRSGVVLPPAVGTEIPLATGYRDISFAYSGSNDANLPRLVTLNLTDLRGHFTRISASPRINTSGDCRFDPISMTCRT